MDWKYVEQKMNSDKMQLDTEAMLKIAPDITLKQVFAVLWGLGLRVEVEIKKEEEAANPPER